MSNRQTTNSSKIVNPSNISTLQTIIPEDMKKFTRKLEILRCFRESSQLRCIARSSLLISILLYFQFNYVKTSKKLELDILQKLNITSEDTDNELCTKITRKLDSLRQNIHSLLRLPNNQRLQSILVAPSHSFLNCPTDSHGIVIHRVLRALRQEGLDVTLALNSNELKTSCLNLKDRLYYEDSFNSTEEPYSAPFDFLLCLGFLNCGRSFERAKFRGLAIPIDSTSFNDDSRVPLAEQHTRIHLKTHRLYKDYMHIVFGISTTQILTWKSLTRDGYDKYLGELHMIKSTISPVPESERIYSVFHNGIENINLKGEIQRRKRVNEFTPITFGFIGGYGGPRKGIKQIIDSFQLAFVRESDREVRLLLYLGGLHHIPIEHWPPEILLAMEDERIECIAYKHMPIIDRFYEKIDIYVALSQFEGFGLTPLEAMSKGIPVITHAWSGPMDYCLEPACYRVFSSFIRDDPQWPNDGAWAVADIDHASTVMNKIYRKIKSNTEPEAGFMIRKCISHKFQVSDIVKDIFGSDSTSRKHIFVGCFKRVQIVATDLILLRRKSYISVEECWQLSQTRNFRFFILNSPTYHECVGVHSIQTRHSSFQNAGLRSTYPQTESFFSTPYYCESHLDRVFEVSQNMPEIVTTNIVKAQPYLGQHFAAAMRPGMLEAMSSWKFASIYPTPIFGSKQCKIKKTVLLTNHFSLRAQERLMSDVRNFRLKHAHLISYAKALKIIESWDLYDLFFPTLGSAAKNLSSYGGRGETDQAKILLDSVKNSEKGCTVISAGSNNVFDFEVDILKYTSCVVHVFDCTVKYPTPPDAKIIYHDWCLAQFNGEDVAELATLRGVRKVQMKTLLSSMHLLGLSKIEVLKIDIEGSEWGVFRDTLAEVLTGAKSEFLPLQIAIELHFENSVDSIKPVAALSYDLHCLGYVIVSLEPNTNCAGCAEILFAKLFE